MIYDQAKIMERWYDYCAKLYRQEGDDVGAERERGELEPEVLMSEVEKAVDRLKPSKAAGPDGIPSEALKAGGEVVVQSLKQVIDRIWRTGEWPEDWTISELITLPKVAGTNECEKYRTISLISHASKVLLKIIRQRIGYYVTSEISECQFGFTQGKGTADAILFLRMLLERVNMKEASVDNQLWLIFVDYAKAFDSIAHAELWKVLDSFGVPKHLTWLIFPTL